MDLQWYYSFDGWKFLMLFTFIGAYLFYMLKMSFLVKKLHNNRRWLYLKLPIRVLCFSSLMIALLGPSFGYGKKYVESIGKDIMIAFDLSKSMDTQDIPPSRIEKLKYEIQNLINTLSTDRIGLIIFSDAAFIHCPLTYDKGALDLFLKNIHTGLVPSQGTNFTAPLELALDRLTHEETSLTEVKSRILILASDGEDFGNDTQGLIEQYKSKGIRVFSLAVGTAQGGKIPTNRGFIKDDAGNPVIARLNYKSLEMLSQQTGGQFYEISKIKNDMSQLIKAIKSIKGERRDIRTIDVSYNKYEYFLWFALVMIFLDFVFLVKVIHL